MLQLTGERTLPGIEAENYWFRRHEAAYLAVAPRCRDSVVLEVGAGEGYGAALLAAGARQTVALDYDAGAAGHLRSAYPGVAVVRGNAVRLPFAAAAFGVVACLQVVEHIWDQPGLIAECARVLGPAGTLLISTPNRLTFPPGNPFHCRELSAAELAELLSPHFDVTGLHGLGHGPRLRSLDLRHPGGLVGAQLAGSPQRWPARLRSDVAGVVAGDFAISPTALEASLDLLFVATRRP